MDVSSTPPYLRDVNTVFQDYALFPHMSVLQNVAYGLRVKGVRNPQRDERAAEALRLVQLDGYGPRKPVQLSGGQRQRVALARSIVNSPRVLLLDEPLGALDLKLREQMQIELKAIQQRLGITFLYVTHDQEEALTMSDRIAVFNEGRIEQVGTPEEIYEHPATEFVAGFVGVSNVLERMGRRFTIRPEKIEMVPGDGGSGETGTVKDVIYVGAFTRYIVDLDQGGALTVMRQNLETTSEQVLEEKGRRVRLEWRPEHTFTIEGKGVKRMRPKWRRVTALSAGILLVGRPRSSRRDAAAAVRNAIRRHAVSGPAAVDREGRRRPQPDRVALLQRQEFRRQVRAADGLQDQAQGRRLLQPDGRAHAHRRRRRRRPVRHGLGLG